MVGVFSFLLVLSLFGSLCSAQNAWAATTAAATPSVAGRAMEQGRQSFQQGNFSAAIVHWQQVATVSRQQKHWQDYSTALTNMGAAYQALGQYKKALETLQTVQELAQRTGDQAQRATALAGLGNVYIVLGPAETAAQHLRQALELAQRLDHVALTASIFNNLGNLSTARNHPQEALEAYKKSVALARQSAQRALMLVASANAAMAAVHVGQYQEAKTILDDLWEQRHHFPLTHESSESIIKIGLAYDALRTYLPLLYEDLLLRAAAAFHMAAQRAQSMEDARVASYAWGYLGHLYERENRDVEALQLTRQAVAAAQQVQAPESLYRWQWQTGRLLNKQGEHEAAMAAYRRAVATLQAMRPELSTSYGKPPMSFRATLRPLYFEFIDLLLRQAATVQDSQHAEPYLREARKTVELFKAAELRDYFQDECVDAALSRAVELDRLSQTAVIVYPILLPDRTELLVSLPQGLKRFRVAVEAEQLERVVRRFREALQKDEERRYMQHAQSLYNWLIRPFEADLAALAVTTLVFVPEGVLLTIPMAALHDGQQFLIEKYALAVTPGLDLTDPQPLTRTNMQALIAGVTESVHGLAPLPYVSEELAALQRLYRSTLLLNQNFSLSRMEQELSQENFGIVHIASHGQFTEEVAQSFIVTFDDKLTMEQLGKFMGRWRFRKESLELLTLSACETALGNDRAALGLAGIAIKAGAKSALATLWRVYDEAAALMVTEFYRQLKEPAVSRAVALQRAQVKLMADVRYRSPFFWSPFLLINNWL